MGRLAAKTLNYRQASNLPEEQQQLIFGESDFADDQHETDEQDISRYRPCFRTDERYFCTRRCKWASQCKKLKADWLR